LLSPFLALVSVLDRRWCSSPKRESMSEGGKGEFEADEAMTVVEAGGGARIA
jgi:hypothetical protein